MRALCQNHEHAASYLQTPLEGLPTVCIDTERDSLALVIALAELAAEQFDRVVLVEKLRLKVETRRQPEIGVRGSREAVHATVTAASVGIDRLLEANVRRIVGRDHTFSAIGKHGLRQGSRDLLLLIPAIV